MKQPVDRETLQLVEALLFLENGPVNISQISKITGKKKDSIKIAIDELLRRLKSSESVLTIIQNEKGDYQLTITSELYEKLGKYYDTRRKIHLSPQAMETLAIIAYKQPITKSEIERIRGVGVGHTLRLLLEYGLIKVVGRKDVPGKPVLYTTTEKFLQFFGLLSLKDLPSLSEYEQT